MKPVLFFGNYAMDAIHIGLFLGLLALGIGLIWALGEWRKERELMAEREDRATETLGRLTQDLEASHQTARTQEEVARQAEINLARAEAKFAAQEEKFNEMAQGAVREAHTQFLQRADERFEKLVEPIAKNFSEFKTRVETIEKVRTKDKTLIEQQVKSIGESLMRNTAETGKLVTALSTPKGGGRWGEMTLRNVMEQAGLSAHCDFNEQVTDHTEDGRQRPDAIIYLPGDRQIVVDSKVSLVDYLEASSTTDPAVKVAALKRHAANVARHVNTLASKSYQSNLDSRVDFVAMFIPGENFFSAALEHNSELLETAYAKNVIITTPSTLIGLAKTVGYVWRQEKQAENAKLAARLGGELYERLVAMGNHFDKLGKSLNASVDSFNKMHASFDTRIFPSARKFKDLEIAPPNKTLSEPLKLEAKARLPASDSEFTFDDEAA